MMSKYSSRLTELFADVLPEERMKSDLEILQTYSRDKSEDLTFSPDIILYPETTEEVSAIMKICFAHKIPVTPRGGGTGLMGASLPQHGGVVMAFSRMNRIIEIDERNLQVTVEPGVITEVLQDAVKEKGLFYPPDPSSRGSCFIGGNVANNSGGPRAVKYGVVKDYVLNLQVVLANGSVIWTGANVLKNATGYNLTQLMVGSEGTLGLVTKIVLRLIPHPKHDMLILVPFNNLEKAGEAVGAIFRAGYLPSALELVEINALRIVHAKVGGSIPIHDGTEAHLLVECDGNDSEQIMNEITAISGILERYECGEIYFASDAEQKAELWKLRRRVAEAVKMEGFTIEEDTVVPRAALPELIRGVKKMGEQHQFEVVCYGHAGDGNLHIRIRFPGNATSLNNPIVQPVLRELFLLVHQLGGTISGEHGIGLIQKPYLDIVMDKEALALMQGIKNVFDPHKILNAGKIFDL